MFTRRTLGAVGGRLCPWRRGLLPNSGRRSSVPIGIHPVVAMNRPGSGRVLACRELCLHTEVSIADFILLGFTQTFDSPWHLW
jgi:hypothetical protein